MPRPIHLGVKLTADEHDKLVKLAALTGRTKSNVIQRLIEKTELAGENLLVKVGDAGEVGSDAA
jgi:hypothetical protein